MTNLEKLFQELENETYEENVYDTVDGLKTVLETITEGYLHWKTFVENISEENQAKPEEVTLLR